MRYSKQRELVMQTVQNLCDHPTAEEIYDTAAKECPGLSLGTVYRNLNSLVDAGRVRRVSIPGKADSFESPYWLLLVGGFCTALAVFYMYAAYHPTYLIDARLRITNMLQIKILVYWAYIITIELVSVGISLVFFCLGSLTLFLKIMVFVIILTSLVTIIAVRMAK